MNIEKLLNEIGQDLQNAPTEMDKSAMRKSMTRRRTIHRIGVAGKTAGAALASLFLVLFVGVNTSVNFARAASDLPVIGPLSQSIIVRDDIKEALVGHEDLEKAIEAGHLAEVDATITGTNYPVTVTLNSVLADDHMLSAIIKLDTERKPEGFYTIQNAKVTNLDTGEQIDITTDYAYFEKIGKPTLFRFAWSEGCENLSLDFDLVDELEDFTGWTVLESCHFEIRGVEHAETRHIPIDQTLTFEGYDFHFVELQISETGTKIIYEAPQDKTFSYGALGMVIEDENGNILAKPVAGSMLDYVYEGDDGKTYNVYVLPSIYFEDISKIRIHITDCFCALFDDEVLTIDKGTDTATFRGETFPVTVYYGDEISNTDLGLSAEYDEHYSWEREYVYYFLVPANDDMPVFNAERHESPNWLTAYTYEYPRTTIDGQEYVVFQAVCWDADEWQELYFEINEDDWHLREFDNNAKYYFVHGSDYETYEFEHYIDLTIG
ncbi:MAG: DUF4179 domain-containing protein [Clostridiales bacterium]|nr:DUF4179 domain-containing protein [Clostridiales bacterium]